MTNEKGKKEVVTLTSPIGNLVFSSLTKPRPNKFKDNKLEYVAKIEVDGDSEGAVEFLKTIRKINRNLGSEDNVTKPGNYFINGAARDIPTVFDKDDNIIQTENVPMIVSGDVRLLLVPFHSKTPGMGGLNLIGIELINIKEYEPVTEIDVESMQKALRGV